MIALIPARVGSKRCPGKNTRLLAGVPLLAYTIAAAQESGIFSRIIVSTDDAWTKRYVHDLGGIVVHDRAPEHATDGSPDIDWVRDVLTVLAEAPHGFAILRPTSPFRTAATIQRAYALFKSMEGHSIRAVQPVSEHPGKMWQHTYAGGPMEPLMGHWWPAPLRDGEPLRTRPDRPWHSQPTQTLPTVYVQNASLEMAHSYVIPAFGTISGLRIYPFFTEGLEGFDINTEADWRQAETLAHQHPCPLPKIPTSVSRTASGVRE